MNIWFFVATTTFLFGSWPIVGRLSGIPSAHLLLQINLITVLITGVAAVREPIPENFNLTSSMLVIGAVAGVMNGFGHLGFGQIITHKGSLLPLGVMMSIVPAVAFLCAVAIGEQRLTLPQVGGVAFVMIGIFLIIFFEDPAEASQQTPNPLRQFIHRYIG